MPFDPGSLKANNIDSPESLVRPPIRPGLSSSPLDESGSSPPAAGEPLASEPTLNGRDANRAGEGLSVESTGQPPDPTETQEPLPADETSDGSKLGELVSKHGFANLRFHKQGGLGQIWLADDLTLKREVAIKVMRSDISSDDNDRTRFLREAEITGALEHPGIVPIYCQGVLADEHTPFYAMRFIRGRTLKELIAEHFSNLTRFTPSQARDSQRRLLRAFLAVCQTVGYAHSRGVIHRDLKPDNIMVGEFGETYVLDWGLAKSEIVPDWHPRPELADDQRAVEVSDPGNLTTRGFVCGSPGYLSPEQARGQVEELRPSSDVFNLGATLYCILTGRPPYADDQTLEKSLQAEFLPPSRLRHDIPPALEALCLKALALEPAKRYHSAGDLSADVDRYLSGAMTIANSRFALYSMNAIFAGGLVSPAAACYMIGSNYDMVGKRRLAWLSYCLMPFSLALLPLMLVYYFLLWLVAEELQRNILTTHYRLGGKTKGALHGAMIGLVMWLPLALPYASSFLIEYFRSPPIMPAVGAFIVHGPVEDADRVAVIDGLNKVGILRMSQRRPGEAQLIAQGRSLYLVLSADLADAVSGSQRLRLAEAVHSYLASRGVRLSRVSIADTVSYEPSDE